MTDVRTEIEEETGLNLFEDKASAVGGFPHAMLGYDKQAVDSYIQDLEQRMLEMKVQLREQRRETSFARSQVGTTDFSKLGAHARALLEAAEAQAAELVRLAEAESDRLRQEARLSAAASREAAQQEADDVRLSGLASLRKLRQEQAEAGQAVLEAARRDANLVRADAEAQSKSLLEEPAQRINAQLEAARLDAARTRQEAERDATAARLATEKSTATALSKQAEAVRKTEENVTAQLTEARARSDAASKQIEEARSEAIKIRESAVEEAEQIRLTATREAEATLSAMRDEVHQKQEQLEEQVAWRKEQLEREVAALMARRTSIIASMQNLRAMAEEAVPDMELTEIISADEVTSPQPRDHKQAK